MGPFFKWSLQSASLPLAEIYCRKSISSTLEFGTANLDICRLIHNTDRMLNPLDYPNIIFDFGGVILNIDVQLTLDAFRSLNPGMENGRIDDIVESKLFHDFEMGLVTEEEFQSGTCNILEIDQGSVSKKQFDSAWNALILDVPKSRLEVLQRLSEHYRLFLLSNTNSIHMRKVVNDIQINHGIPGIDELFEKVYYSHILHKRKPDIDIYEFVLRDSDLDPSQTIFLDDNPVNLEWAKRVGMATYEVGKEMDITEVFNLQ